MPNPIKILIVEDEMLIALNLKRLLRSADYTLVSIAVSGEQAVQIADADPPDLALMDVHLIGDMDGIELADYMGTPFFRRRVHLSSQR